MVQKILHFQALTQLQRAVVNGFKGPIGTNFAGLKGLLHPVLHRRNLTAHTHQKHRINIPHGNILALGLLLHLLQGIVELVKKLVVPQNLLKLGLR
jgi:hypothetical protein